MKVLVLALPLAVLLGSAAAPPAEVQTGRSVAVDPPRRAYWLSDDLNRLFLQKPASTRGGAGADKGAR